MNLFPSRRDLLARTALGGSLIGLAGLLADDAAAADRKTHHTPKAKRVVQFFYNGGPSHIDTFDPKPLLKKYDGKTLPNTLRTERKTGTAFPSPFEFKKYGQSGLEFSELFSLTARHADRIAIVRSMKAKVPNHEPSLMLMNCGDSVQSRPSLGSWVLYGLGSANKNLPGFVALSPGGYPIKGPDNWQAGFLPGTLQGTYIDPKQPTLAKLIENIEHPQAATDVQRRQLDLLATLNAEHKATRHDPRLDARIENFELAFRMQAEAADAFDVDRETKEVQDLYGRTVHGRQTLIARRLLERGVRFVQLWSGVSQPWDHHKDLEKNHRKQSLEADRPLAALITDLARLGMLEDTLVIWGGEFGRTPTVEITDEGKNSAGRDHNPYGFSIGLAGGGIKGGTAYGATDDLGFAAVENITTVHDLHATILNQLGFDHEKLTYRYAGRDFRLTDTEGTVIKGILAS
ncbi:DUF1501 domain-containing protein [soil metagenome]